MRGNNAVAQFVQEELNELEEERVNQARIKQIRAEENQAWAERRSWAFGYDFDAKFQTVVPYPYRNYDPLYDRELYDLDLVELTVEQMLQLHHKREVNQCYDEFWEQKVIDAGFYGLDGMALFEQECAEQGHLGLDKEEFCLDQDYSEYFVDTEEDYQQYCAFIESLTHDRDNEDKINTALYSVAKEKELGLRRRLDWRNNKPGTKNTQRRAKKNMSVRRIFRRRTRGMSYWDYMPTRLMSYQPKHQAIEIGLLVHENDLYEDWVQQMSWDYDNEIHDTVLHQWKVVVLIHQQWNGWISRKRLFKRSDTELAKREELGDDFVNLKRLRREKNKERVLAKVKAQIRAKARERAQAKIEAEKWRLMDPYEFFRSRMLGRSS
jgi:hypothetical protein